MENAVNILSYVESLKENVRDMLYESPWTCQAVFRSLQPLAKQYVLRMVWIQDKAVEKSDVDSWINRGKQDFVSHHFSSISKLQGLGILQAVSNRNGESLTQYRLHQTFKSQLLWALSGRGQPLLDPPTEALLSAPTSAMLDAYAHKQWETLQLYILTTTTEAPELSQDVPTVPLDLHRLLVAAGLLQGSRQSRSITSDGFQFLLQDHYRQLWLLLTEYIKDAERRSTAELSSVLSFLMQLGFRRVGQPCALTAVGESEQTIAGHMMQLGVLMPFRQVEPVTTGGQHERQLNSKSTTKIPGTLYFCPTRLAASLCDGFKQATLSLNSAIAGGHVIVETNYRVYGFSTSSVQVAILQLFCRTDCILPNAFVGTLTRESVLQAVDSGISADDVIDYLRSHAHPQAASRAPRYPVVPEVVADQIRLWEAETVRVCFTDSVLYDEFDTPQLYESSVSHASSLRVLLWQDDANRRFAARQSGHERIRDFIKSMKEAMAAAAFNS
ncbi:hypothetical protein CEUSTIGMA_g8298.t1 [Chlamydomonas eustigma]|uniref:RNA polymerase II transcription factor B subunit 2 n=1 Tax=Chlamydomonas eustigma TaxID=1157962 RepID=A0A250XCP4_9CHLO|nr:hypothetical protein CEUSTIGMA_g8298.t1 [Chlamydomonas eustigma]|eukprot:GAX80863.1 hypothetical protein CEUSTIGMA_g8298.t1 [Chlamydomonas eustigma]